MAEIKKQPGYKEVHEGGTIPDAGNSIRYKTGDWRTFRPVHNPEKCTNCMICWTCCPDSSIIAGKADSPAKGKVGANNNPELANFGGFDLDHCKGCGICADECPFKCIVMKSEKEFKD